MQAIAAVAGKLCAAMDPSDSVGIIDSYFPDARFFTEFERFDRYVDKVRREGSPLDFISICSPNYLHDAHIRFALRSGSDAICEKPLVLNPHNVEALQRLEDETGSRINTILQLRLHPAIIALREKILARSDDRHDVDLTYITPRGRWYHVSWKGNEEHSGGIATNIGVHFFDMLSFLFGEVRDCQVHHRSAERAAGFLEYDKARVRWFLSINEADVPEPTAQTQKTFRSITVDGEEIEFSGGFADLHTRSYEEILADRGFRLAEVMPSIETVATIRNAPLSGAGERHPFLVSIGS
jgi:UDP-N-acetyl-2-amino-2-deoxyglucuronate dehydrogenase